MINNKSENLVSKDAINISKSINIPASLENWESLYRTSKEFVSNLGATRKEVLDVLLAIEEIFVNIARYAYPNSTVGDVWIYMKYIAESKTLSIVFEDKGIPFDPTAKEPANTNLSLDKRKIGGLGIYMARKLTNLMEYEYIDNKNHLVITKKLEAGR